MILKGRIGGKGRGKDVIFWDGLFKLFFYLVGGNVDRSES